MDTLKLLSEEQKREVERQLSIIRRGAAEIIPEDVLEKRFQLQLYLASLLG